MPLREGSLVKFVEKEQAADHTQLCLDVLKQILSALDYLASKNLIHRDVKPDNILYYALPDKGGYRFQLADFGLAHHRSLARTFCGTGYYQAPELWPQVSKVYAPQSPKMDVFSLYATIAAVESRFQHFPPRTSNYGGVLSALEARAPRTLLEPMARLHPDDRASAAQMLASFFEGWGLTTSLSRIPPIKPMAGNGLRTGPSPSAGPSNPPRTKNNGARTRAGGANGAAGPPPERGQLDADEPSGKVHRMPGAFDDFA